MCVCVWLCVWFCVCRCVRVCVRQRDREREKYREAYLYGRGVQYRRKDSHDVLLSAQLRCDIREQAQQRAEGPHSVSVCVSLSASCITHCEQLLCKATELLGCLDRQTAPEAESERQKNRNRHAQARAQREGGREGGRDLPCQHLHRH